MTEAERERAAIVEWLRGAPFPWLNHKAKLRDRIFAAWSILIHGEGPVRGLCHFLALKVERLDHHKDTDNDRDI